MHNGENECTKSLLDDAACVLRAQNGDKDAVKSLLERYGELVRVKCREYFLVGADNDDLYQEGMIGLFKAIRDYDAKRQPHFRAFAQLCITRQIITAIKSATRLKHMPLNSYISFNRPLSGENGDKGDAEFFIGRALEYISPEDELIDKEQLGMLEETIGNVLSDLEKKVLSQYILGRSYFEIASMLHIPVKSVDNAVQRIKKKLNTSINRETGR